VEQAELVLIAQEKLPDWTDLTYYQKYALDRLHDKGMIHRRGDLYLLTEVGVEALGRFGWHQCIGCQTFDHASKMNFGPDPYLHDLEDDETPVWLHVGCANDRVGEI
jgi:hypothetical protein